MAVVSRKLGKERESFYKKRTKWRRKGRMGNNKILEYGLPTYVLRLLAYSKGNHEIPPDTPSIFFPLGTATLHLVKYYEIQDGDTQVS